MMLGGLMAVLQCVPLVFIWQRKEREKQVLAAKAKDA
jgi:hypothetical protein